MDDGKRKTLIEWVNSLAVQESIESLNQLNDGRHFLAIANLIEGIPQQNDIETNAQRWEMIKTNIEGLYQCGMDGRLSMNIITCEGHEFEIAKVCLLLMSAAMLCERNTVFVDRAMNMDVHLQYEIREMVEWVIQPNQNLYDLDPCFHQVLCKPLDLRVCDNSDLNPQASSTPQPSNQRSRTGQATPRNNLRSIQEEGCTRTPVFSTSILERFTSPGPTPFMNSPLSPVQQMVQSPLMANKIRMQQKEHKIKLLERELNAKRHLIAEYESEIEDKRKELDEKDQSVLDVRERLQQALRRVGQLQDELEDARIKEDELMQNEPESSRVDRMRKEMSAVKTRNAELEKENTALFTQLHAVQDEVAQLGSLQNRVTRYETDLRKSRQTMEELREALSCKEKEVVQLREAAEQAFHQLDNVKMDHRQQIRELEAQLERSASIAVGESLGGVMEIQFKEQLASLETQLGEYQETLQHKASHILELMTVQEQLMNDKSELSNLNEQLQSHVQLTSEQLENTERTLNETIEMSTMWEQKAQLLETNLKDERRSATSRIHELEKSISEIKEISTQKDIQLSEAQGRIYQIEQAMQDEKTMWEQKAQLLETNLKDERRTATSRIHELEKSISEMTEVSAHKDSQLSEAQGRIHQIEQAMQDAQKAFSQQDHNLREQINRSENQIQELLQKLQEEQQESSRLKEQVSVKQVLVESLEVRACSMEEELNMTQQNMKQSLQEKESQILHLKEEFIASEGLLNSAQQNLGEQLSVKEQEIDALAANVTSLEEQLSGKGREVDTLETKVTCLEEQFSEAQRRFSQEFGEKQELVQDLEKQLSVRECELKQLQAKMTNAEEQLINTQKSLSEELDQRQVALNATSSDLEVVRTSLASAQQKSEEQSQEIKKITEEQTALQVQFESFRKQAESEVKDYQETISKLQDTLRSTTEDSELMITELKQRTAEREEMVDRLKLELRNATDQAKSLNEEARNLKNWGTELEQQVKREQTAAEERKSEFAKQLEMATTFGNEQNSTAQHLLREQQEGKEKIRELKHSLEALESKKEYLEQQLAEQVAQSNQVHVELRQQSQETEIELRQVSAQFETVSSQLADSETALEAFKHRVREQEMQVGMLEDQLTEVEATTRKQRAEIESLEKKQVAAQEEASALRQELNVECERAEVIENELMETQQVADNKTEEYLHEIAQLRANIQTLRERSEASCAMYEKVEEHLRESKAEAVRIEEQRARDQRDLENAQHHINELQDELEEAKFRSESLEGNVEDYQNRADTLEARLKEFMEDTEGEKSTLQIELSDSDSKLQDARKLYQEAQNHIELTEKACQKHLAELELKTSQLAELMQELSQAKATISQKEEEIKALKESISHDREELKFAQEALFTSEKEKEATFSMLENSRLSLTGKEDHLGALQDNMYRLKEELEASNKRCQELQETLSVHEHKASSLAAQLLTSESEAERTVMKLEGDLERADEELEHLHSELQEYKENNSVQQKQINELKHEFTVRIEKSNSESKKKIDSMQHMLDTAVTNHNAICAEYEQKIAAFQQEATAVCQQYEGKIQQLQVSSEQTESKKGTEFGERLQKLEQEHKEELKILGSRIESLTNEHQDLKCWEISERNAIKELEQKCTKLEEELTKSQHENVMYALRIQAAEKKLNSSEKEYSEEQTELSKQLVTANETNASLKLQLVDIQSKLDDAEASLLMIRTQEAEKNAQLKILQDRFENMEEQVKELTTALEKGQIESDSVQLCHLQEQTRMEDRCKRMEEEVQRSSSEVAAGEQIKKKHEDELAQQRDVHFEQLAELEIKYQLELERMEHETESLDTELTKVKSELNHKKELLAAVEKKAAAAQNDAHAELLGLEKEKLQMEGMLESLERQLKTAKADYGKAMRLQEVKSLENVEMQQKARRMEREIHTLMEREKRHLAAHQRETSMGADMNARLQSQLAEKEAELHMTQEKYQKEVEMLTMQLGTIQETCRKQLNDMEERNTKYMDEEISLWKNKFEQITESFNQLEDRHAASESERQVLVEQLQEMKSSESSLKQQLDHVQNEVRSLSGERDHLEERLQERSNLENQLREEEMLSKRFANQVRSLEAQLDHATRQLKADGQRRSLVPPPPPPHLADTPATFRRALQKAKETTFDKMSPKSSPEFAKPFDLRSNKSSEGGMSIRDCASTPGTNGRYISRLSLCESLGPTPKRSPTSSVSSSVFDSARSTRSRAARLSSSSSTSSYDPSRSIPIGTGSLFWMEDEPMEFEWGRLSELQRRNTLCLPHMKSSYPAELQTVKPGHISEKDVQKGEPLAVADLDAPETRSQSRKRTSNEMLHSDSSATTTSRRKKQSPRASRGSATIVGASRPSTATLNGSSGVSLKVYPHYSPHLGGTPKHKLAKSSPASGTPGTSTSKKRKSPRGTPKGRKGFTPIKKPKTPKNTDENVKQKAKPIKTPMSFSIGFTPKKGKRLTNLIRRKKAVSETPKETPKSTPKIKASKKPLGDHN